MNGEIPCCSQPVRRFKGKFCRCCGSPLRVEPILVVGCDRAHFGLGLCPFCNRNTCCADYLGGREPIRRFCEDCGGPCDENGNCTNPDCRA